MDIDKKNRLFRFTLLMYLILITGCLLLSKNLLTLEISNSLLVLFVIIFSFAVVILFITQDRNASNIPLFNNSLAFIVIFSAGIAIQVSSVDHNIWTWVIIGVAAVGSVQNIIAPILEQFTKKQ